MILGDNASDTLPVPERIVTFGPESPFGPDLVYTEVEMLLNETRNRELYGNWQQLFPSLPMFFLTFRNATDNLV